MQSILDYLHDHYFLERELDKSTKLFYLFKIGVFGQWLGRVPTLDDLNSTTINRFIVDRLEVRSRETVRGERSALRSLWADAHERGDLPNPPSRLRKIKKMLSPPIAWSEADLRRLLIEAARQRGLLRGKGISRAAYWRMFILVTYQTGLRLGDLERLKSGFFTGPGTYIVTQGKTKKPVKVTIDNVAWDAILATNPHKREFLVKVLGRQAFYDAFDIITKNCDLHGKTKMIRKAAGSLFERDNPGEGHKLLGNGRDVFLQYYADPNITDKPGRMPPRLSG